MSKILKPYVFVLSIGLLLAIVLPFMIISIANILQIGVESWTFFLSLALSIAIQLYLLFYFFKKENLFRNIVIVLSIWFCLIFLSIFITKNTYDNSFDGIDYQQRSIIKLYEGWNPLYEDIESSDKRSDAFLNSYPKGPWYSGVSSYFFTDNIETSKYTNYLIIPLVGLISFFLFTYFSRIPLGIKILASVVIAMNPVFITQANTLYIDSIAGGFFIIWTFLLLIFILEKNLIYKKILMYMIPLVLIYAVNIKFTASAYVFVSTLFVVLFFIYRYIRTKNLSTLINSILPVFVGGILAVLLFGFEPYVTNSIQHKNPFYPVYGESEFNSDYLIRSQYPDDFVGENRVVKLYKSIFSKTANVYLGAGPSTSKSIFSFDEEEFWTMKAPDVRVGGFGPLFGLILTISFGLFLSSILIQNKNINKESIYLICIAVIVLCSALINPESWWARYASQLWLIPILLTLCIFSVKKLNILKWASVMVWGLILINVLAIFTVNFYYTLDQRFETNNLLSDLKNRNKTVYVFPGIAESGLKKFERFKIDYSIVESIDDFKCGYSNFYMMSYSLEECTNK